MEAPCDFIGRKIKVDPPQKYKANRGAKQVTILLVSGGRPYPLFKDEFMPSGCGTQLTKVRVYADRVSVESMGQPIDVSQPELSANCPSNPMDEVFFAAG